MKILKNYQNKLVIKSEEERLVFGEIYVPYHVDSQGDSMTPEEIKKTAYNFLKNNKCNKVDVQHSYKESGCAVVESFIARKNDPDGFTEHAWVGGVEVVLELWEKVKSGEINCFSFAGKSNSIGTEAIVIVAKKMVGETSDSINDLAIAPHSHSINLILDADGNVIKGMTGMALNHYHIVNKISSTEQFLDHNHRIIIENE